MNFFGKISSIIIAMLLTITLAAGCGGGNSNDRVVYLNYDDRDVFANIIKESFNKSSQSKGLNVEFFDAKGDINVQVDQMKKVINDGAAVIVLCAADANLIVPLVEEANKAGITIITINRAINGGEHFKVHSEESEAGKMQADYMAQHLPQGAKIVYLEGSSNQASAVERWEGFKSAISSKRPDVEILDMQDGSYSKTEGMKIMATWLNLYPKIDGVVCGNDQMALGAINALKAANRLQGCLISGVDAVDDALKAVAAGEMAQTIKQDALKQGEGAAELAEKVVKGQTPSSINVPFVPITKENLSQFMK